MNTLLLDSLTAADVERSLPSENKLGVLADFFDALSDVTRLKIVSALSVSKMCVSDLSALTGINQTTTSHQLRTLKTARIVESTRQGKVVFYSIAGGGISRIMGLAVGAVYRE